MASTCDGPGLRGQLNVACINVDDDSKRVTLCSRGICCRRASVCPSVSRRYCVKTAKFTSTLTTLHGSAGTLIFDAKDLYKVRTGSLPTVAPNAGGVG